MNKKLIVLFWLGLAVFLSGADGAGLVSGEPLACGVEAGPLAYPGISNQPVGAVYVYNSKRPDIFLYSSHFAKGLVLYKYVRDKDGVPVFGSPRVIDIPGLDAKSFSASRIFQDADGSIHGLWCGQDAIYHGQFDPKTLTFGKLNSAKLDFLPRSPNALEVCQNADGSCEMIIGLSDGQSGRAPAFEFDPKYLSYYRSPEYSMYDGAGVSRGGFPYAALYSFAISRLSDMSASGFRLISPTAKEVRVSFLTITKVNFGPGREKGLVTGSENGGLYYYRALSDHCDVDVKKSIVDKNFITIRHPAIWASPIAYPNPQTGYSDLISGAEGGTYFYRFTGKFSDKGSPVFDEAVPVLETDSDLYGGTLTVPDVVDWDGDGSLDIVSGNSQGFILFFRNDGTNRQPNFLPAVKLTAGGRVIHIQAGYGGSIQGPGEARWGYTCPTTVDWNNDGLPDIVMNDITSRYTVYMNKGTAKKPDLDHGSPLYFDGLELHGTWRCKPAIGRLGDQTALITLDDDDQLHLYYQVDIYNLSDGGKLKLSDGSDISANFLKAGGTGRLKLCLFDWDGDNNKDLIIGTPRHASVPNPDTGYPWNAKKKYKGQGSAVLFMKNIGTDKQPVFEFPMFFKYLDWPIFLGQHSCSPAIAHLGSGDKPGLLVGVETGRYMFYAYDDLRIYE